MITTKLWIKFDDLEVDCFCEECDKKCPLEKKPECKLYLAKFIEIERPKQFKERCKTLKDTTKILEERIKRETKKFETQLQKSIRKMKYKI